MSDKKLNIKDLLKEGMPSALCSGCWDMDELEKYLKQCEDKKAQNKIKTSNTNKG